MKDLLVKENGDIDFSLGVGRSNEQHQQHCLIAQKGSVKQYPDAGVGIENYLNGDNPDELLNMVRAEFVKDGMKVNSVAYDENTKQLDYEATYPDL